MTTSEKAILNDLVNGLESLAVTVDSIEAVLIRKGFLTTADLDQQKPFQIQNVVKDLAALRSAIAYLPVVRG